MSNNESEIKEIFDEIFGVKENPCKRISDIRSEFTDIELKFIENAINRLLDGRARIEDERDIDLVSLNWLRRFLNSNEEKFGQAGQFLCNVISSKTKI